MSIATVAQTVFARVRVFVRETARRAGVAKIQKETVRQILTKAWTGKNSSIPPRIDTALSRHLILGGVGGVAWNNLKHQQKDAKSGAQEDLKSIYRFLAIQEGRDQEQILKIGKRLVSQGITPLTFKGRVLAGYYSPTHVRPTGDLDIIVPEGHFNAAVDCLMSESVSQELEPNGEDRVFSVKFGGDERPLRVDLHNNLSRFGFASTEEVFLHSMHVDLPDPPVFRMPSLEHHIRIVTIHFLRHGGWRPLWLCDIGALMEEIDSDFKWELCLGEDLVYAEWVVLGMKLAEQMLGAQPLHYPDGYRDMVVPDWVADTVDKEWNRPDLRRFRRPKFSTVSGFRSQLEEIVLRWPNPLMAMTSRRQSLLAGSVFLSQSEYFWKRCKGYLFT